MEFDSGVGPTCSIFIFMSAFAARIDSILKKKERKVERKKKERKKDKLGQRQSQTPFSSAF